MRKFNYIAAFLSVSLLLLVFIFALNSENKNLRAENNQLQREIADMQVEYFKIQIQRDEAIDAYTQLNNHLMKKYSD